MDKVRAFNKPQISKSNQKNEKEAEDYNGIKTKSDLTYNNY